MRTWIPAFSLLAALSGQAHANGGESIYKGTGNHVKVGTGLGLVTGLEGGSVTSLTPTVEGRFKLSESLGLQVVVPFAWVSTSSDAGDGGSRFDLANPSVALEFVLDQSPTNAMIVRAGVSAPLMTAPELRTLADLGDTMLFLMNSGLAMGTHGGFNMWRYAPESLGVFGEIAGSTHVDDLYLEFGGGVGVLIPTGESDAEIVVQASAKLGYGTNIIPFIGFGFVVIPTEYQSSGDHGGDAFQASAQLGVMANLGGVRLDVGANFNLDKPFGTSFDDNGVFGVNLDATIPF